MTHSYLRIEINTKCNLRCAYCRTSSGTGYAEDMRPLTLTQICRLIDAAEELGFHHVVVTGGGEPFLRDDIHDILNYGRIRKIVITNGTPLTVSAIARLSECETLDYLRISFDGPTAQREVRGVKKDFPRHLFSVLDEAGLAYALNTVLTSASLRELGQTYDIVMDHSCFSWGLYPLIAHGRASDNVIATPLADEVAIAVAPVLRRYLDDGMPFLFEAERLFTYELLDAEATARHPFISVPDDHPCGYQMGALTVRATGEVSQCSRLQKVFGNIHQSDLTEIISGTAYGDWQRERIANTALCQGCRFVTLCAGGCLGRKQLAGFNYATPDSIACAHMGAFERHILPLLPLQTQVRISQMIEGNALTTLQT